MKKTFYIAILLLASAFAVYPCGSPGILRGQIMPANATEWAAIRSGVTVQLSVIDCPTCEVQTSRVNPFGYYGFPFIDACGRYYVTPVAGKQPLVFTPAFRIVIGGSGDFLHEDFTASGLIFID